MTELLDRIASTLSQNAYLAPLLALVAGLLTSFTPCSLSSVPLVVSYVGGASRNDTKRALWLSLTFAGGSAITFTALGVIASLAGSLMGMSASWWYLLLGVLMVLMALQTWGVFEIIPSTNLLSKSTKRGYLGALVAGMLGGVFSSPCSTPVLIALLAMVAGQNSLVMGIVSMLFYGIGHGVLAVVAGTSTGFVQKLTASNRYGRVSMVLKALMGAAILAIGLYMFYLGF
jgi:cytochrome c biogenesis protein CcdA